MHRSRFVYNKIIMQKKNTDFNVAADHDSATVAYLLAKRRTQGGYNWTYADVKAAQGIVARGIQLPFGAFLPPTTPIAPRSAFNLASEDYVKHVILEEFGVLCQIKIVTKDKKSKLMWLMGGVCPFHRHSHDNQHWAITNWSDSETHVHCFFPINESEQDLKTHYPRAILAHLPLVCPGDGPSYPVAVRTPPLEDSPSF